MSRRTTVRPAMISSSTDPLTPRTVPGGKTVSAPAPAVAITSASSFSTRTIVVRSKGTRPRSSRMKAPKACSSSSDEPAHDRPGEQQDAGREGGTVGAEAGRAELVRAPPLGEDEEGNQQKREA